MRDDALVRKVASMLTPRQIEVSRAILVTGTAGGAARRLNVASPGISQVRKHAESTVGMRLSAARAAAIQAVRRVL